MKNETYTCDIAECGKPAMHKNFVLQVIFLTKRTESGMFECSPYLENTSLDLCENCMSNILQGNYVFAVGISNHTLYKFMVP